MTKGPRAIAALLFVCAAARPRPRIAAACAPSAIIEGMGAISERAGAAGEELSAEARTAPLLQRFFPVYCALLALVTFGYARYDAYQVDGDAVAYMDIGDLLRAH